MTTMKILVASVYASEHTHWSDIQSEFVAKNTSSDFDHVFFSHGRKDGFVELRCESRDPVRQHLYGLGQILEMFSSCDSYTHCLVLDSDAFPVERGWDLRLLSEMESNSCSAAAPIRFENLDTFFHPCVVFLGRGALSTEVLVKPVENLLGYSCDELVVSPPGKTFPLLRSNVYSPHPVAASVYHEMFYHHGFGSRSFFCRSVHINRYHVSCGNLDELTGSLFANPDSFISRLKGSKLH